MEINGKPVKDAKKHLKIHITKSDCEKGMTKDARNCAAAVAIVRENPGVLNAEVNRGVTYVEYDKHWLRYLTPPSLKYEIVTYDRVGVFEPGTYTVSPPPVSNSIGYVAPPKKKKDNRKRHDLNDHVVRPRHDLSNIRRFGGNR